MWRALFILLILLLSICYSEDVNSNNQHDDDDSITTPRPSSIPSQSFQRNRVPSSPPPQPSVDHKKMEEKRKEAQREHYQKRFELYQKEEEEYLNLRNKMIEKENSIWKDKSEKIMSKTHEKAMVYISKGDFEGAIPLLERASAAGNPESKYQLGRIYEYGEGVAMNFSIAFEYYKQSADLGNAEAQRSLGFFYDTGKGTKIDKSLSLLYYSFAAENFDLEASHVLGYKYSKGYDVVKSCSTAAKYIKRVALEVVQDIHLAAVDLTPYIFVDKLEEFVKDGDIASNQEEVISFILLSALNGDPNSMAEVGFMFMEGVYGFEKDYEKAKEYLESAVDLQSSKAMAFLGNFYERGCGVPINFPKAIELYQRAADKGSAIGMNFLGEIYLYGKGNTPINYEKALSLFKRSAAAHAQSAVNLGKMYFYGYGVPKNFETAIQYFRTSASADNAEGLFYLATSLYYGLGSVEDCATAVEYYKKVTYHGSFKQDYPLALYYFDEEDYEKALLIYEKLAERGLEVAQSNVGWIYDSNLQTPQFGNIEGDNKDLHHIFALKYYRRSADQGNSISHLKLGDYYYYGKAGLEVDYVKAFSYYRHISTVNAQAKYNLGYMHHFGEGITRDLFLAKRFYDSSLETDPNGFIPVKLSLALLGFHYAMEMIENEEYGQLWKEAVEYFIPESFFASAPAAPAESSKTNQKADKLPAVEPSIWDSETIFGYNLDTVMIFTLFLVLFVALLIRNQIILIQFQ